MKRQLIGWQVPSRRSRWEPSRRAASCGHVVATAPVAVAAAAVYVSGSSDYATVYPTSFAPEPIPEIPAGASRIRLHVGGRLLGLDRLRLDLEQRLLGPRARRLRLHRRPATSTSSGRPVYYRGYWQGYERLPRVRLRRLAGRAAGRLARHAADRATRLARRSRLTTTGVARRTTARARPGRHAGVAARPTPAPAPARSGGWRGGAAAPGPAPGGAAPAAVAGAAALRGALRPRPGARAWRLARPGARRRHPPPRRPRRPRRGRLAGRRRRRPGRPPRPRGHARHRLRPAGTVAAARTPAPAPGTAPPPPAPAPGPAGAGPAPARRAGNPPPGHGGTRPGPRRPPPGQAPGGPPPGRMPPTADRPAASPVESGSRRRRLPRPPAMAPAARVAVDGRRQRLPSAQHGWRLLAARRRRRPADGRPSAADGSVRAGAQHRRRPVPGRPRGHRAGAARGTAPGRHGAAVRQPPAVAPGARGAFGTGRALRPSPSQRMYCERSSSLRIAVQALAHVGGGDRDRRARPSSGASNARSSSTRSMIVCSRRAPMFSMRAFTSVAMRAISATASGLDVERAPSRSPAARCTAWSARSRARSGCARSPASDSDSSSTRIGKRPCSSGIRSLGFETWNAPAAMNST